MAESKFNDVVKSLMDGLEGYARANTVVGEPIVIGDTTLIPLIDISVGMGAGAGINAEKRKTHEGGAVGARMNTSAFLLVKDGAVRVINVKDQDLAMKIVDLVPEVVNRLMGKTRVDSRQVAEAIRNAAGRKEPEGAAPGSDS